MKYFNRKRFKLYKLFILDEKRGIVEGLLTCIITKKKLCVLFCLFNMHDAFLLTYCTQG